MLGFLFLIKRVKLVLKLEFNFPLGTKISKKLKTLRNIEKHWDIENIEQFFNILTLKHGVNVEN
jgi:hypothetical protein